MMIRVKNLPAKRKKECGKEEAFLIMPKCCLGETSILKFLSF